MAKQSEPKDGSSHRLPSYARLSSSWWTTTGLFPLAGSRLSSTKAMNDSSDRDRSSSKTRATSSQSFKKRKSKKATVSPMEIVYTEQALLSPSSKAEGYRRRKSLEKRKTAPPVTAVTDDECVGLSQMEVAEAHCMLGNMDRAFALWDEALALRIAKLGLRSDLVAQTHRRRGSAFLQVGLYLPAVRELEQARSIECELLELMSHDREMVLRAISTLLQLAKAQDELGIPDATTRSLQSALVLQEQKAYENGIHLEVARVHCLLGKHFYQQKKHEEAQKEYRKVYDIYQKLGLSETHPLLRKLRHRTGNQGMVSHMWGPTKVYSM